MDEKVTERVLYEILIQAGYIVDLHIPRDKESKNHKGFAFAEYETEEVANYAVRLFSGLVRLHNKQLRFAMSGQDKPSQNSAGPAARNTNASPTPKPRSVGEIYGGNYSEESPHTTIIRKDAMDRQSMDHADHYSASGNLVARGLSNGNFEYSQRVMLNGTIHSRVGGSIAHPFY